MQMLKKIVAIAAISTLTGAPTMARKATQVFRAQGDIVASPVLTDNLIIVTSADSVCYALRRSDFSVAWQYKSLSPLRTSAIIADSSVFIETGNAITCLKLSDGTLRWKSPDNTCSRTTVVDRWDYHRSQPVLHNGIIYCGDDFGWVYGTDLRGKRVMEYHTGQFMPLRSSVAFCDSTMYFADWEGTLYGYDLAKDSVLFKFKTITAKPYDNYGAAITPIVIGKEVLMWGGRSSTIHAYDYRSNLSRWRKADGQEAWFAGTPVFFDNNVLIGSSDSKMMYCFEANSGNLRWSRQLDQNVFSAPLVTKKEIIACDGNAYEDGYGIIYFMSKINGTVMERITVKGSIFSTPVELDKKTLIVGSVGGYLYKID